MTENYYRTRNYKPNHSTFGGIITNADFNTNGRKDNPDSISSVVKDIISDWRFDEQCRKNIENRMKINKKEGIK